MIIPAAAGVLCILYGMVVLSVGSGSKFYLVWMGLGVLFFLLAGLIRSGFLERHLKFDIICGIVVAAGIILLCILNGVIMAQFHAPGERGLDYIIVLGAQVHESGPSVVLKYRLDKAAAYLAENENTLCIVSGGQGSNEPFPEAEGMCDYLVGLGIDEARIIKEDRSKNTTENIAFSKALMGEDYESVGIVTNNFHVFRGTAIARKQGIEGAVGISAPSNSFYLPNNLLREVMGICKDFALRNL
jgi:uncharacterized SAM-binding protein YcdF (DUF218 family)